MQDYQQKCSRENPLMRKHRNNRQVIRTVCKSNKRKSNVQEKRRESLADISKVLCLRKTENRGYHIIAWKARRTFLQHTTEYEFHGMAVRCIVSIFFGIFYTKSSHKAETSFKSFSVSA